MLKANVEAFKKLMQDKKFNTSSFARYLELSRSTIWRVLQNGDSPGEEFIAKFKNKFPKLKFEDYFFTNNVA